MCSKCAKLEVGLVLRASYYDNSKWSTALTWPLINAIRTRFKVVDIPDQEVFDSHKNTLSVVFSMEPDGI